MIGTDRRAELDAGVGGLSAPHCFLSAATTVRASPAPQYCTGISMEIALQCPGWAGEFLGLATTSGGTIKMNMFSTLPEVSQSASFASLMFNEIMKETH